MDINEQNRADFLTNIRNGDVKLICDFIDENKEIVPFENENGDSAAATALKSKQLAVYEALISRAWCLNSSEDFYEIVTNLEKTLKTELREIHNKITQNPSDLTSLIHSFLDQNRYILLKNEERKSALTTQMSALIARRKNIENIVTQFHHVLKSELREIHRRNFIKNPNEEHLITLITRTSIYFGGSSATSNRRKYLALIAGAYEQLNSCREIKAILKVVANFKNLKIIFDFDRNAINHADATGNENVYGKSYAEKGDVYIGAKGLRGDQLEQVSEILDSFHRIDDNHKKQKLAADDEDSDDEDIDDEVTRSEVLGVIAHELCHVAIFRIYDNDYKPYLKGDSESEKDFENVLEHCWENRFLEVIIALALNGSKDLMYDELCVRVPHLLALYQEDNEKINFLRETFKKLFDYFEKKTLPDFEKEIELMSAFWKLKSKEPQHLTESKISLIPRKFELEDNKFIEISSNCPQMTMSYIFQEMSKSNLSFLFLALNYLSSEETYNLVLDAHSSCIKPRIFIDCDNETEKEIIRIAEEMRTDTIKERIIFVHIHERFLIKDATAREVSHSWLEVTHESRKNLLKVIVNFQGEKIPLAEIVACHCLALDSVPLKELLDNYLKIGNDLEFPEIDFHVKRKFLNSKSDEIELLNIVETAKVVLLSDDPGMGKTTELKMLAIEMKKKFKNFWVTFVDLKEYSEVYEKDENFKSDFNSSKEFVNFFAKKILKLNEFEEKVFEDLFSGNRVAFLMDGFDEISPSFKKFVKMLISSINKPLGNILVISTRPHLKNELCRELNIEAFTLLPLTEENCVEILDLSFKKNGIMGEDLKYKTDQTKEFFKNLKKSSDLEKNPLILRMIAKVFTNNEFSRDMQLNVYSIYENFIKIMIMDSMVKGEDAREEAANCLTSGLNIISFYQKEAYEVIFDKSVYKFENCFCLCFNEIQSPSKEQITRVALMKSDGSGKCQFIHRTFAEFFVADFLFKNLFDWKTLNKGKQKVPMNKERLNAIYEIAREIFGQYYPYLTVRPFLDGAFEKLILNIELIEKKEILSTFTDIFTFDKMQIHFEKFFRENLIKIITVITLCAKQPELKRLWMYKDFDGSNHFVKAARWKSLYFNTNITELARKVFDEKNFQKFFTEKNVAGDTVASIAYHDSRIPDVMDFYCDTKLFPSSCGLHIADQAKINLFLLAKDVSGFQKRIEEIKEDRGLVYLNKVLSSPTLSGDTVYVEATRRISSIEDFEIFWNFLRNVLGETDFKTLLLKADSEGATPLMWKVMLRSTEVFNSFWRIVTEDLTDKEKKIILMDKDKDGRSLFDWATVSKNYETFLAVKDLYLKAFGEDKMRIILTKESRYGLGILWFPVKCFDGNSVQLKKKRYGFIVAVYAVNVKGNILTLKNLWTFIQEICDIPTQKTILMRTDKNEKTFLEWYLRNRDIDERTKIFEPFIEQHFSSLEKEQFIN